MLRDAFFHPEPPAVELRAFTHGLQPKTVPAMMQAFADDWRARGVDAWNAVPDRWQSGRDTGWWNLPEVLGDAFLAPLLGVPEGTAIHLPSVHAAVAGVLSSPEVWQHGHRLVTTAGEFPSVLHTSQRMQRLLGIDVDVVPQTPDGYANVDGLIEAIRRPGTALVAFSHVGFSTGERLLNATIREIVREAHAAGALVLVDGYHATGSLVIGAEALGVDLYTGGLLKEACGSAGNAYLYIRDGLDLTPATTGWFGGGDPFAFGLAPDVHPDVRRRFLGGTTSVASLYHAVEGVRVLLGAGLDRVEAHVAALSARAVARAQDAGLRLVTPDDPARRGALLVMEMAGADEMVAYLKTRHVFADGRRGRLLRIAPFVWNDAADVDRCFDVLTDALHTGAHRGHRETTHGPVT